MKKTKRKPNLLKLVFIVAGAVAAIAAIGAILAMLKKRAEAEKEREAEIEEEIRTILEEKLADVGLESDDAEEAEGEA